MSGYEKDIQDLIRQMQAQQQPMGGNMNPGMNDNMGGTDQSPHLQQKQKAFGSGTDQSPVNPVNSVRPMGAPAGNTPPPPISNPDACPQCGTMHPPLPPGQPCPMAPLKTQTEQGDEKVVDVNKYLTDLKNIVVSQAESKGVKDYDKLFKNITMEIVKYLEGYSE